MSETKEIRKEWIGHGINCMTVLDADGLCYQAGGMKRLSASMLWKWGMTYIWVGICLLTVTYRKVGESVRPGFIMQENFGAICFGDHSRGWICVSLWVGNLFVLF